MRLDRLILREIHLPLREPFRISSGEIHERKILLCELTDADGATVMSECVAGETPNYTPETLETAWLALTTWIAPRLLGVELAHPRDVHALLEKDFRGHNMAKAAVEMGMWGLESVRRGMPLADFMGGTRARVPVGISLGIQRTPEALVAKAEAAVAQGYQKVKIKVEPGRDVAFVEAARRALPEAHLMADANNAYTLDDLPVLKALDGLGLMMIEQPLAWDDLVRHAVLQRELQTPVCLDESITSLERAEDMVALGSGRIVNIKPGRVGGFTASLAIHDFCQAQGIPVWCGGMFESGVGRAYNVALASLPNFTMPGDLSPSSRYWTQDVVDPEWTMTPEGEVIVPRSAPGIGVAPDMERIAALSVRTTELRA
jgi:O-succinylbenzoate synthase